MVNTSHPMSEMRRHAVGQVLGEAAKCFPGDSHESGVVDLVNGETLEMMSHVHMGASQKQEMLACSARYPVPIHAELLTLDSPTMTANMVRIEAMAVL